MRVLPADRGAPACPGFHSLAREELVEDLHCFQGPGFQKWPGFHTAIDGHGAEGLD